MTQNASGAEDLRVRRTRKMLLEALIDLTIERGFAAVTVRDIAERAMVNRATFYRHYLDKYDLLDQYMADVYTLTEPQAEAPLLQQRPAQTPDQPPPGLVAMLEHVRENADFYRVMLGKNGDTVFTLKVQLYIEKRFRSQLPSLALQANPGDPPLDLVLSYLSYAGLGAIVWWLDNTEACPPEQIATWLEQWSRVRRA